MRPGLTAFGLILLLFGTVFYLLPTPTTQEIMSLEGEEIDLSVRIATGVLLLGLLLLLLGLILPAARALPYYIADSPRRRI